MTRMSILGAELEALMSLTVLGNLTRRRGACALIAIKERARCKTRLADVLSAAGAYRSGEIDADSGAGGRRETRRRCTRS